MGVFFWVGVVHRLLVVCAVVLFDRCARCVYSIGAVVSVICAREPAASLMFWRARRGVGVGVVGRGELIRLLVPMVDKGVVESMLRVLVAVQGEGAEALTVQEAACSTFLYLSAAHGNKVRSLVAGRCARSGCGCGLGARCDASALRMFGWRALCLMSCRFLFHCCCHARRLVSVCVFVAHRDVSVRCMFTLFRVHDRDVG